MASPAPEKPKPEQPVIAFVSAAHFEIWLTEHHGTHHGIWLRIYKKASQQATVTYAEALDIALCHGWIDGQKKPFDAESWLQKFTKRGPRSVWSKVNTGHIERLEREGRMKPLGREMVEAAKADGRWEKAYQSSRDAELPEDFLKALAKSAKAKAFFETLNKSNRYSIFYRLQSAKKPETRARRMAGILAMLKKGEKFH